jgi:autophagy-related protein 9
MMNSNILSRLLPSNPPTRSIYDDLRAHDEASESDLEEQAGMALDEENLGFRDDDLGNADVFGEDSRVTTESTAFLGQHQAPTNGRLGKKTAKTRSKWQAQSPRLLEEDGDDDVPASLLIEDHVIPGPGQRKTARSRPTKNHARHPAIPGTSNRETRAHWEAAQAQQRLHRDEDAGMPGGPYIPQPGIRLLTGSSREKAMWRWINVTNIDNFIKDVYDYFTGSGIWCIVLTRVLELL